MRITGIDKKGKMLTGHPVGAGGSPARHGTPVQNPLSAVTGLHVGRYSDIKPEHLDMLRRLMNFRGKQMRESTLRDIIKVIMEEKKSKKPYKGFKKGKNHPEGGLSRSEAKRQGIHAGIETKDEAKRKGGFSKLSKKTQGRRKSFCGRMCGMKRKNTSSKTARDPKSKINASLRVWGCRCEETCHECDKQLFGEEAAANAMGGGFSVQQAATQANPSLAGYDPPMGKPLSVSSFDKLTPTPNTKNSVKKALDMWRRRKIAESTLSSDQVNKKEERVKELKKQQIAA
jgi:hypothetical protein